MLGEIRLYNQHTFDSSRQIPRGKQASLEIYVCRLPSNATLASYRHTDQIVGKEILVKYASRVLRACLLLLSPAGCKLASQTLRRSGCSPRIPAAACCHEPRFAYVGCMALLGLSQSLWVLPGLSCAVPICCVQLGQSHREYSISSA